MAGIPREVLKWIQSLDLTNQLKTPKWDLSNGFMLAEIFSWYFPQEVLLHMYNVGDSFESKEKNWYLLRNFLRKNRMDIPHDLVEGTIHCKEGAAQLLLIRVYEVLTNHVVESGPQDDEVDFTDALYQARLPMHARNTASRTVKTNIRNTELVADPNILLEQYKAQSLVKRQIENRRGERQCDPERFEKKPSLAERAPRLIPPASTANTVSQDAEEQLIKPKTPQNTTKEQHDFLKQTQRRLMKSKMR